MSPTPYQIAQILFWFVGGIGAAVTAWKAIVEMRRSHDQAERELRWRKAKEAKTVIEEVSKHPGISAALRMIDWDGRFYLFPSGKLEEVTHAEMIQALGLHGGYSHKEAYIRDCFDDLFDALSRFEAMVISGLIEFADVRQFFSYYAARMRAHGSVFDDYIAAYGFKAAGEFLSRLRSDGIGPNIAVPRPLASIQRKPNN